MRRWISASVIMLLLSQSALAQEQPRPEQLRKMYDDTLVQLKQAQDRKNELAAENEKLNAHIADLQKQLDLVKAKQDDADKQIADFAEKTFSLRSHYEAFQLFVKTDPRIEKLWRQFLMGDSLSNIRMADVVDRDWPWSSMEKLAKSQ